MRAHGLSTTFLSFGFFGALFAFGGMGWWSLILAGMATLAILAISDHM